MRTTSMITRLCTLAIAAALLLPVGPAQADDGYAPLDRPGPPLSIRSAALAASLTCTANLVSSGKRPVLLLSGTTINAPEEFDWNWEPALRAHKIPYCVSTAMPAKHNMGDITIRAQYVVYAIRHMHKLTGRKVRIVGHSQGGMIGRWALRFWPGTRSKVAAVIGLSPSNHGTKATLVLCATACQAAWWQQDYRSNFLQALNSGQETFPGINYTNIYTRVDEVVIPGDSAILDGPSDRVRNVATQDICPLNLAEHLLTGSSDPVTYALAFDALTHGGLADPARIDRTVCLSPWMPYVNPATAAFNAARAGASALYGFTLATPALPAEPQLPCYVYASCTH